MNMIGIHANKKGFTLIELMVTIAIIAVLAAVAVPSCKHSKKVADATNRIREAQIVCNALKLCHIRKGGLVPGLPPLLQVDQATGLIAELHGASLPRHEGLLWAVQVEGPDVASVQWCPDDNNLLDCGKQYLVHKNNFFYSPVYLGDQSLELNASQATFDFLGITPTLDPINP